MNFKRYRIILELLMVSVIVYVLHKLFFYFNPNTIDYRNFYFSLEIIYGFFISCSLLILLVLIQIRKKNIDNVGNTFLLLTCAKLGVAYYLLTFILNAARQNMIIEKKNFFIVFAVFLAIETILTIRILNNKQ